MLVRFVAQVIEAPASAHDPRQRERIRLLNGLLLSASISLSLGVVFHWFYPDTIPPVSIFAVLLALAILGVKAGGAVPLSFAFSLFVSITPQILWSAIHNAKYEMLIAWTLVAGIIAYLLHPVRPMLFYMGISLFATGFAMINAGHTSGELSAVLYFSIAVDAMLTSVALLRDRANETLDLQTQRLELEQTRINLLLEAAQEGIVIHRDGKVLLVNPAFERLLGYSVQDLQGNDILDIITPSYHDEVLKRYRENIDTRNEVEFINKAGKLVMVEMLGRSYYYRGERLRILSLNDVTERKQHEEREIDLAIEREKVRILQNFINDISHDLRTPLSVINTSIYLIGKLADDPERQRAQINVLAAQEKQVQRLLEDLITMSRLDKADTQDFVFGSVDLDDLLKQMVNDMQNDALRKNQVLVFQPGESTATARGDPIQLKRMMRHLILNAVSYTPKGGEIVVRTFCEGDKVVISVKDNGPGIPEHILPHIFDQFYRGDEARGGGGIGLGLTIARKIALAHGGNIEVVSQAGDGSDFRVVLPRKITNSP